MEPTTTFTRTFAAALAHRDALSCRAARKGRWSTGAVALPYMALNELLSLEILRALALFNLSLLSRAACGITLWNSLSTVEIIARAT